jgi:hypothetical protein
VKKDREIFQKKLKQKVTHDITAPTIPSKHFEMYPLMQDGEEESDHLLVNKPIIFKQPLAEDKMLGPGEYEIQSKF